jgi:hypothetical protein
MKLATGRSGTAGGTTLSVEGTVVHRFLAFL